MSDGESCNASAIIEHARFSGIAFGNVIEARVLLAALGFDEAQTSQHVAFAMLRVPSASFRRPSSTSFPTGSCYLTRHPSRMQPRPIGYGGRHARQSS